MLTHGGHAWLLLVTRHQLRLRPPPPPATTRIARACVGDRGIVARARAGLPCNPATLHPGDRGFVAPREQGFILVLPATTQDTVEFGLRFRSAPAAKALLTSLAALVRPLPLPAPQLGADPHAPEPPAKSLGPPSRLPSALPSLARGAVEAQRSPGEGGEAARRLEALQGCKIAALQGGEAVRRLEAEKVRLQPCSPATVQRLEAENVGLQARLAERHVAACSGHVTVM